ncbi:MAG: hypothetical protein R2911_23295 [Caldilineaceae bacterium]
MLFQRQSMFAEAESVYGFPPTTFENVTTLTGVLLLNQLAFLAYLRHDYATALQLTKSFSPGWNSIQLFKP